MAVLNMAGMHRQTWIQWQEQHYKSNRKAQER